MVVITVVSGGGAAFRCVSVTAEDEAVAVEDKTAAGMIGVTGMLKLRIMTGTLLQTHAKIYLSMETKVYKKNHAYLPI